MLCWSLQNRVPTPLLCEFFSISFPWVFHDKIDFPMTKFRHIPGIKLLKNVSHHLITRTRYKCASQHFFYLQIFFLWVFHEFWHFCQIPWVFQSWKIKLKFCRFSMTRRNPAQLSRHCHYCAESERKAIFTHPLQTQTIYPSKHSTVGQRCINVKHMFCVWAVWYHRYKPDQYP